MSKRKLEKYIEKPLKISNKGTDNIIILGHSIVRYLREQVDVIPDEVTGRISFIHRPGATFDYYLEWVRRNLQEKVIELGRINLFIFLGTCDLTKKSGKFIILKHLDQESAITSVVNKINELNSLLRTFDTVKPIFLAIPPYSITYWNKSRGEQTTSKDQDFELHSRILHINSHIEKLNEEVGVTSPRFAVDLLNYRKGRNQNNRVSYNFGLYIDGIHPIPLLAKYWLKRIISTVL